jgi:hypothetical protein
MSGGKRVYNGRPQRLLVGPHPRSTNDQQYGTRTQPSTLQVGCMSGLQSADQLICLAVPSWCSACFLLL